MIIAGITGGIGTGKTAFCKMWEKLGAYVLYADDYAKELMNTDAQLKNEIINLFGAEAYFPEGTLNRAYLAEEAFEKGRVAELNALVHPVFRERIVALIKQKEAEGTSLFAEESALLLNQGRPKSMDVVIMIKAAEEDQIDRAAARDNADPDHITSRLDKQPDYEELEHLCDYVVENTGSLSELEKRAEELFDEITAEKDG